MTAAIRFDRPPTIGQSALDDAVAHARRSGRSTLYSQIHPLPAIPDPVAFLAAASEALGDGILWEQQRIRLTFAGAGAALPILADGVDRFSATATAMRGLPEQVFREDDAVFPILGGFAFAARDRDHSIWQDFPDGLSRVPQVVLQWGGNAALIRVTLRIDPEASPARAAQHARALVIQAHRWAQTPLPRTPRGIVVGAASFPARHTWSSAVAAAVKAIGRGTLAKVVLAREERLRFADKISPFAALARLRDHGADAAIFALQSADSWFVGASPERLVRLQDRRVDVSCLAGSTGKGNSDEERRELAASLLSSAKDREEHEIVVRVIEDALADICDGVQRDPGTPRVVTARSVQHLETPVSARLSAAGHVLDLVERLHPTPAVGGHPRDLALSLIENLEGADRGWYAGPIGWMDLDGDGEFAVAIRSALIRGDTASLYAGCGIVADSDPAAELAESDLKLQPMLAALGAS